MPRAKRGFKARRRRKKILKMAKGYWGAKSRSYAIAAQAILKSLTYSYIGRKQKKRNFRKLWITRINAAARINGISYSKLISGLNKANIKINRKSLSELAIKDPGDFSEIVTIAKSNLS
ncbi:MAG: 50S ribosomal protein L20 [Candidatus Schekmanbacteria bacterium RIFCSPLOWO2_02_FULL_38_14]|uniref:Large ribosomal subunit protein bL20 n=1 Tax=Candidatus Schekmanbacteria bacterium RIFCSPLOWO2_12_FULL_38_15 TaxID=1817883 RepID=A0A1F7SMT6_9BACT|nr:MAG: 50S ribosomal protein L20 [Candidatus Schekmanbacteria bacterium RIFCSPLOWO2_02_FULL_38_14]OGL55092.1 MAG: 50S ribosomal protein L20 [Candidatus Schekmanbacteria bacterium RIFCSPLOWO2_12_FULL_38_15]